eukprot:XP_014783855.1 PREDICTED: protein fantom-like [Octopus bimaculoides]
MTETSDTTVSKEHFLDVKIADPKADQHKKGISSWNRGDLEDRYLRLYEDHIYLKKHCHKQEDRLKRLGTKVMQLVMDRKKSAVEGKGKASVSGGSVSQETVNDMETKMYAYEKQNKQLKEKLRITKQHLLLASKQATAYNHVQPRINTGLPKPPPEQRILKNRRVIGPQLSKTKMKISSPEDSPSEVDLQDLSTMRLTYQSVLGEMDRLTLQLKEEQSKQLSLQQQLKMATSKSASMRELQEQIISLQNDKQLLVESNDKLTRRQLEATINADLGERSNVIDRLNKEIAENSEAERMLREVRIENYQLQEQNEELKKKMSFFTSKSDIDITELEEALTLVRSKQDSVNKTPSFVMQVDAEIEKVSQQNVQQLESDYAAMVHELEKTRNMLLLQYKINKDYHKEIEAAHQKTEHTQRECEIRLNEYATLLDIRAARIKKMESQLRDIAYGTKQQKLALSLGLDKSNEMDENIQLERGQNIFEIHVHKVNLTTEASGSGTFLLKRPVFDFTSQYVITIDDFFLHYIQKSSCTLELQQSLGQSYKTLAACQLTFRDLFEHPPGRIHNTAFLIGIEPMDMELKFGSVEYWINLRLPMEQAVRLYKERIKALGYISSNDRSAKQALKALDSLADQRPDGNINELHVKILRCTNLTSRRKDVQPSPYCVYQFFDFPDHDTVILHSTNNPEFNDHRTFPVVMNTALDNYLRSVKPALRRTIPKQLKFEEDNSTVTLTTTTNTAVSSSAGVGMKNNQKLLNEWKNNSSVQSNETFEQYQDNIGNCEHVVSSGSGRSSDVDASKERNKKKKKKKKGKEEQSSSESVREGVVVVGGGGGGGGKEFAEEVEEEVEEMIQASYEEAPSSYSDSLHVDYQNNYEKRQFLASMLLPDDPDRGCIRFTVVSEPEKDTQTEECEEVGVAFISLVDILKNKKDIVDEEIPIYGIENQRHQVPIGRLNVSVICLKALQAVDREIVRH